MTRPGNLEAQFRLFSDYASHVARFGELAEHHRIHQPPCLVLWGRHDTSFDLAEIMGYARALDRLEMHVYDAGHMLLETLSPECAAVMGAFVRDVTAGAFHG